MKLSFAIIASGLAFGLTVPAIAAAGPFGGFTDDGRYVVDGKRVCQPITGASSSISCTKLDSAALAKLTLERPKKEQGVRARFAAKTSGTVVAITAAGENKPAISWDTGAVAGAISAVYVNKAGDAVAVEYESRFGGRMITEVVGFKIAGAAAPRPPAGTKPKDKPAAPAGPKLSKEDLKKYDKHLSSAWKQLKRKKWAKAAAAASSALTLWDQSAEGLIVLASAKARQKNKEAALGALEKLATSADPAAPEYRVEARTATAFASLRANPRFRRAVGITPDPNRPLTAYERVMGFGGKWEQRLISCEQPEVKLRLRRVRKRFSLNIKSRCGGTEKTFLDGTWATAGTDELKLSFPNQGGADEGLSCLIERCRDSSGEDCVRCRVDEELEFLLRVIRR